MELLLILTKIGIGIGLVITLIDAVVNFTNKERNEIGNNPKAETIIARGMDVGAI